MRKKCRKFKERNPFILVELQMRKSYKSLHVQFTLLVGVRTPNTFIELKNNNYNTKKNKKPRKKQIRRTRKREKNKFIFVSVDVEFYISQWQIRKY